MVLLDSIFEYGITNIYCMRLSPNPFCIAIQNGNIDAVKLFIEQGVETDKLDKNGYGPIHYAAYGSNCEIMSILIDMNADVNIQTKTKMLTALHIAAYEGHKDVLNILIDNTVNTDVDVLDRDGRSAMHYAAQGNKLDALEFLADYADMDVNLPDRYGCLPINLTTDPNIQTAILKRLGLRRPSA
jgi:ankyrin repeat protein